MTDFRSMVTGAIVGASVVILTLYMIKSDPQPVAEPTLSKGTFRVIDHYKDCDLVQYQYGMLAEYKYFLDCPK